MQTRSCSRVLSLLIAAAACGCGGTVDSAERRTSTPDDSPRGGGEGGGVTPPSSEPPSTPPPATVAGSLSLVAGGLGGSGSADDHADNARFRQPQGVVSDGNGNVFIADTDGHTIRKLVIATGDVTTLAGLAGQVGSADGVGSNARFAAPRGLTRDPVSGNLFISDRSTIRMLVVATGAVTTLAGSGEHGNVDDVGSAARFDFPAAIALGAGGGVLYVADSSNHAVRQVDIATKAVTTLATGFNLPRGITTDGAGSLFVADGADHVIWKVDIATKAASVFAGAKGEFGDVDDTGAAARFNYPTGVSSDGAGNLFVSDSQNHTIRKISASSGVVTTLAGSATQCGNDDAQIGASARFCGPFGGISSDGAGNLFVADTLNHTIRQVVIASGAVTTLAGKAPHRGTIDETGAAARFSNPYSIATIGGDVFVADTENHTIRKVSVAAANGVGVVTTVAGTPGKSGMTDSADGEARFHNPGGITADAAGNIFVADSSNQTIRKIAAATGVVTTFAGTAGKAGKTNTSDGEARFYAPVGLAMDNANNLFVADCGNNALRKVETSGVVTTITTSGAGFACPWGVVSDNAGHVFVADNQNHAIRKVDIATGAVTTLAGGIGAKGYKDGVGVDARFDSPRGLSSDNNGNLYVADYLNHVIRKVEVASGKVTTYVGTATIAGVKPGPLSARLAQPSAVMFTATGTYVIDENSLLVARETP